MVVFSSFEGGVGFSNFIQIHMSIIKSLSIKSLAFFAVLIGKEAGTKWREIVRFLEVHLGTVVQLLL